MSHWHPDPAFSNVRSLELDGSTGNVNCGHELMVEGGWVESQGGVEIVEPGAEVKMEVRMEVKVRANIKMI